MKSWVTSPGAVSQSRDGGGVSALDPERKQKAYERLGYDYEDITIHFVDTISSEAVFCLEKKGTSWSQFKENYKTFGSVVWE
jgi:hypothetical protein